MAIFIQRDPVSTKTSIRFWLPDDAHDGPVSVVGSFNEWAPGIHTLEPGPDGERGVTIVLSTIEDIHFRYLGSGGVWFDDPDADEVTEFGSLLHISVFPTDERAAVDEAARPQDQADTVEPVADADAAPIEPPTSATRGRKRTAKSTPA
jgi:hypothetical protein